MLYWLDDQEQRSDLDTLISRTDTGKRRRADAYVFQAAPSLVDRLATDDARSEREQILKRAAGKPTYLLRCPSDTIRYTLHRLRPNGLLSRAAERSQVSLFRQHDLLDLYAASTPTCELLETPAYHFLAPSGQHCPRFLRVADMFRARADFDRAAFWLRPYFAAAEAVLVDTSAIAAVALRTMQVAGRTLPFEAMRHHSRRRMREVRALISRLLRQVTDPARILFLVSLSDTGSAIVLYNKLLQDYTGTDTHQVLSLYVTPGYSLPEPYLCRLPASFRTYANSGACPSCKRGSTPLPVDPLAYYVKTAHETPTHPRPRHFSDASAFLTSYFNHASDVLRVHRDDPHDERHHAFDISVRGLLGIDSFRRKLTDALATLPRPDIIVAPGHIAGRLLGEVVGHTLQVKPIHHETMRKSEMDDDTKLRLDQANHLCIVDDVINTGSRLREYCRSLREDGFRFQSLSVVVGVCRLDDARQLDVLSQELSSSVRLFHGIHSVESIVLPSWDSDECPWCLEYETLTAVSKEFPKPPPWLEERIMALRERKLGLSDEPLLLGRGLSSPLLGRRSFVGPHGSGSLATAFGVASSLQRLRTDSNDTHRLSSAYPAYNVLGRRVFRSYNEALLRALLLRTTQVGEWTLKESVRVWREAARMLTRSKDQWVAGEVFLAIHRGILRPPSPGDIQQVVQLLCGNVSAKVLRSLRVRHDGIVH